jgi:glycosyltransferase involved in cell wall biosynthesis
MTSVPRRMRILYSHRIQSRDGMSVHIDEMVAALRAAGHEVLVVGPRFYEQSGFGGESRLVAAIRRWLPGAVGEFAEVAYNIPAYLRLRAACRSFRPDLIYERYNLFYLAGLAAARRFGLIYFVEVNAPLVAERASFGGLGLPRIAAAMERLVWRGADRIFTVTGVLRDVIAAAGVERARIDVVPNGIVAERFATVASPPTAATAPLVLGFVGFVRDWHGLDGVIRAIATHRGARPIHLVVIGDGPARPGLERLAAELGMTDRVRFTGLVAHAAVPAEVARFDIALQPRVVAYASPLKIFDYMAAGRAIVAPDQPNIREVLDHERTALLFDPTSETALWQAVLRLAADDALRQRLGTAAAAELVRRDFTWRGNAGRVVARAEQELARLDR